MSQKLSSAAVMIAALRVNGDRILPYCGGHIISKEGWFISMDFQWNAGDPLVPSDLSADRNTFMSRFAALSNCV